MTYPLNTLRLFQVDAFADRPFAGNPAAVVLLDVPASEQWMQNVAAEMNLAETAFLVPRGDRGYDLRWFTPVAEVDLCGHATLAAAHVLWTEGFLDPEMPASFETASGRLIARLAGDQIVMDFPAEPANPTPITDGLAEALGARAVFSAANRFDAFVELENEAAVRSLDPDLHAIAKLRWRGVIVTAKAEDRPYDFVSRFFAPRLGIPEDPVTGSAHCSLGPYWAERLGRRALQGYQASSRGGLVGVEMTDDRVLLKGKAITVFTGELLTTP